MRFALNHTDPYGRTVLTDDNLPRLLDRAVHGDTLHKLSTAPENAGILLATIENQLRTNQYTKV